MSLAHHASGFDCSVSQQQREYIRHPASMPIEVKSSASKRQLCLALNNVSNGGLSFTSPNAFHRGSVVNIKIATRPIFRVHAVVQWCRALRERFELGVRFLDRNDAFRVRMVEQVCHIEQYREDAQRRSGKRMSKNKASQEWIEKHAKDFPV